MVQLERKEFWESNTITEGFGKHAMLSCSAVKRSLKLCHKYNVLYIEHKFNANQLFEKMVTHYILM